MKIVLLTTVAALGLAACGGIATAPQLECNSPEWLAATALEQSRAEPVFVTKTGLEVVSDYTPMVIPCYTPAVVTVPPVTPEPPIVEPPVEPPIPPVPPAPEPECIGNPGNLKCVGKAGEQDKDDDEGGNRGASN